MAITPARPTVGMYEAGTILQCKQSNKKVIEGDFETLKAKEKKVQTNNHEPAESIDKAIPPITSDCTRLFTNQQQTPAKSKPDERNERKTTVNTCWATTEKLTIKHLEAFATKILPTSVQIQLSQPFGKDTISQSFFAAKSFCHVLLPLLKSGYLSCRATKTLEKASFRVRQLQQLRKKYSPIDFRQLQGFQSDWESTECIRQDWRAMTTACALHYNGDIATVVRYIGGPHVNAHINAAHLLAKLKPIVTTDVFTDVTRILTTGAPAYCNAEASQANFDAYLQYGNHKSAQDNPKVFEKTIVKQSKRGLTLIMDPAIVHFTLNTHLTPQGLVDILHHRRKPRPISDSSFRPWPGAHAINDWTSKATEPKLHFADSFQQFLIWQWNLAISYPQHDRHTGDDDVQCAFPRVKYNPNLVAMHSAISQGTLIMHTGLTFGDNTSPSNWEPIARARQQLAQKLWHDEDILERAQPYLPNFTFEPPATQTERDGFAIAIPDTKNRGVFDKTGIRIAPRYNHHVDDNMYGDISELMPRAAAASIISLYELAGYPDGRIPDPISWEKFGSAYGHIRRVVGWNFNTRSLTYTLPDDKRQSITNLLQEWDGKDKCNILEAATLHGTLADASRANRQGRTLFFSFQNALRRAIQTRFNQVRGFYNRQGKSKRYQADLPKHLHTRIDAMIARDMAALLWTKNAKITIDQAVKVELANLHQLLADRTYKWEMHVGHVIPRDPQFTSFGDACLTGGGAFCHDLQFWFDMHWSDRTKQAIAVNKIHINLMEFVVVIVQLAATITLMEETGLYKPLQRTFPNGIAKLAKLLIRTDNSPSQNWAHKVSAKSERGQQMVHLYAALLERTTLAVSYIREGAETRILSLFPPESRALIKPGIQAVQRAMDSNSNTAKTARTIRSRRIHYFIFCHTVKLTDDWRLQTQSQERANYQLALYATHLATGSSLHCRSLKAGTIRSYLLDVAKFLGRFRDIDPRFRSTADTKLAPAISKVLVEVQRWESVPNRREPFTLEMQAFIACQAVAQQDDCCLDSALANWTMCNLYAGCRGIEWMQTDSTNLDIQTYHKNRFGNAYAFTLNDVQCATTTNKMLLLADALAHPETVGCIRLRFEEQKNGENGEKKLFVRNTKNPKICFVTNFMCILARHAKITKSDPKLPLSVYKTSNGMPCNITSTAVETCMRDVASKMFNLDPVKNKVELQMWSAHSLRVGACTTLYAMGFHEMEIKHLLRWKSNAFMTYLRNLAVTSRRHNDALHDASCIPNFL